MLLTRRHHHPRLPVCGPQVPDSIPALPGWPPPQKLTPPQRCLQAEYQSRAWQRLPAAVNPSHSVWHKSSARLSLSGFLQGWISPCSPVAASQRRFVAGIKHFPFTCIIANYLAWLIIVGMERCLEQMYKELGKEKSTCI